MGVVMDVIMLTYMNSEQAGTFRIIPNVEKNILGVSAKEFLKEVNKENKKLRYKCKFVEAKFLEVK